MAGAKNERIENHTEIDLRMLATALWKHAGMILLVGIVCGALAFVGTHILVTPQYQSTFTAYVNNHGNQGGDSGTLTSSDLVASQSLVKTYSAVITSRSVLESAAAQAGAPYDYSQLKQMVSTGSVDSTEIIRVSVTMPDPQMAAAVAQAISEVAGDYITKIVEGSSMQIVDQPVIPVTIYSPSYSKNAQLGIILGIFFSALIVMMKGLLDNRIKDANALEERYGIPIIGSIPNMEAAAKIGDSYAYTKQEKRRNR